MASGDAVPERGRGDGAGEEETAHRLRERISQELWEHQSALRGLIRRRGYREPDLSDLSNETQARYFQARMRPGFVFAQGPWPFLVHLFGRVRADFHRGQKRVPVPVEDARAREEAAEDELLRRVDSEAIASFLEKHLAGPGELAVYLLTHLEDLGPVAIAARLGIDRKTVTARLRRAEKRLRSLLPDELGGLR
ncbi:sigma-70 family RNA polymerase sigma factor [Streptomyces sp. SPB074]|uniref:sigma-70 family RNA polymerase sigma factor n=1 Tax=Streptomyces sp. (strain SPB074) TaxID=465543 RepID=UPI00017F277A|nr:sigma-70 family RNA polymerase sigma factor [Streptomyces sp. SPB074]EDY43880.1 sigma-70 family RNA polymerase sigma factor [Streptomyces sp. SPB074]